MIYFIQHIDGGRIKIGTTKQLRIRLVNLQYESGVPSGGFVVLAVMEGGRDVEKSLHERFADLRIEGEWFQPDATLKHYIASFGRLWDGIDEVPPDRALVVYKADERNCGPLKEWLKGFATRLGVTVPEVVDLALREFAEDRGFRKMPKRHPD